MSKYILLLIIGCIIGIISGLLVAYFQSSGTLRIANDDGEGPYLFLELEYPVEFVAKKKLVVLKVQNKNFLDTHF